jgi:uncharacterized protein
MALKLYSEPVLHQPVMMASWPGIANIGLVATDTLRTQLGAQPLGEIEPWDFFYPRKITVRDSILESLEFPGCNFYYTRQPDHDVIIFVGEEQPTDGNRPFAEGRRGYQMASMVVDVAQKFACKRVYASGAAVSLSHHSLKPRVWVATSSESLNKEMTAHDNTILMGRTEGKSEGGSITGLNGLVLGVARSRGLEAVCLMGEVPDYLATAPLPYPRASKSVLELMSTLLGVQIDYTQLDEMSGQIDSIVGGIYEKLPDDIRERVEQRKTIMQKRAEGISEQEEKWLKGHIEDLFKGGGKNERAG